MSSRNRYLNADQRQRALALYQSLQLAQQLVDAGERDVAALREAMEKRLDDADVHPEYIEIVANGTCDVVEKVAGPTVVVLAAQVGPARLIDNLLIHA